MEIPLLRKNYTTDPASILEPSGGTPVPSTAVEDEAGMSFDDLKIRDLTRLSGEWTPPIGVMGGPLAHELYADLVVHAGLQLFRDTKARPWVVLRDGAQRRAFLAPSAELRSALDRFRMRRNMRPVPEDDIENFVRVVEARTSDPDVAIPILTSPVTDRATQLEARPTAAAPHEQPEPEWREPEAPSGADPESFDESYPEPVRAATIEDEPEALPGGSTDPPPVPMAHVAIDATKSNARSLPKPEDRTFGRYVRALQTLVHDGSWMGTTEELAKLTHDDPLTMFDTLLRYRSELAHHNVLIANIETEEGFRWLAVNRATIRGAGGDRWARPPMPTAA